MMVFLINQTGFLLNDFDTLQNPSTALKEKPEWVKKFAQEISAKFNHFTNIKEEHDIFKKKNDS